MPDRTVAPSTRRLDPVARAPGRTWDAATYERLADWQGREGLALVEQLGLRGDETVLDAGCGTGRLTRHLLERLPDGQVIAVDASAEMLDEARRRLGTERVDFMQADLADLELEAPVDAIVSGAAFHWVLDQHRLFARMYAALRPGGRLLAWSGGVGSHADLYDTADELARTEPYAQHFQGWTNPIVFATAEETADRLAAAGFVDVSCRLEPFTNVHDDPEYYRTISLGAHLQQLPPDLRDRFFDQVLATQSRPYGSLINKLHVDARRAPSNPEEQ